MYMRLFIAISLVKCLYMRYRSVFFSPQYPHDLLTPLDNTNSSISDVMYVKLFNPENAAPLSSYDLIEPVTFRIPLKNFAASYDVVPAVSEKS